MPEGDTIFRAARTLHRALAGSVVTRFETPLPALSRVDTDHPIAGRTIEFARATGKWLEIGFSGGLILLTHMLMSGSWHIYRPGEPWRKSRFHMRVAVATARIVAVAFNVTVAEFHTQATLQRRRGFSELGPDILAGDFNPSKAVNNLANHPDLEIGTALLTQSILAGLGNVFKSEICFLARVHPFRHVGDVGREKLEQVVALARTLMTANSGVEWNDRIVTYRGIRRTTRSSDPAENLWVYRRNGQPCRQCGTEILSCKQGIAARTSFWCPVCQPM